MSFRHGQSLGLGGDADADGHSPRPGRFVPSFEASAGIAAYELPSAIGLLHSRYRPGDDDERNDLLSACAELEDGEFAVVRASLRHLPQGRDQHWLWIDAMRRGEAPGRSRGLTGLLGGGRLVAWVFGGLGRLLLRRSKQSGVGAEPVILSEATKNLIEHARHKHAMGGPLYETTLRVAVVGTPGAEQRLASIRAIMQRALHDLGHSNQRLQSLVWTDEKGFDAVAGVLIPGHDRSHEALRMSAEELAPLVAPFDAHTRPVGVHIVRSMKALAPKWPNKVDDHFHPGRGLIPIGVVNAGSEDAFLHGIHSRDLDKHLFGVGQTGSGKSVLIGHLVNALAVETHLSTIVIDPLGNLGNDLLVQIARHRPERLQDVVIVDLLGTPEELRTYPGLGQQFSLALNPLDIDDEAQVGGMQSALRQMLETQMNMTGSSHPRAINYTEQALTALLYANLHLPDDCKLNLIHILAFLRDPVFRQLVVRTCPIASVHETFGPDSDYDRLSDIKKDEHIGPLRRAFQPLVTNPALANIFSSSKNRMDWVSLIGQKKIVIVKLAGLDGESERVSKMIGSTLIPMLLGTMNTWGRLRNSDDGSVARDSGVRLVIDEAPVFITDSDSPIVNVLAVGRQKGFGVLAFAQYAKQFESKVFTALMNNTYTKIALVQEDASAAEEMARIMSRGEKLITGADIANPDRFHGYAVSGDGGVFAFAAQPPLDEMARAQGKVLKPAVVVRADRAAVYKRSWAEIGNLAEEMKARRTLSSVVFPETENEPERAGERMASTAAALAILTLECQADIAGVGRESSAGSDDDCGPAIPSLARTRVATLPNAPHLAPDYVRDDHQADLFDPEIVWGDE